MVETVFYHQSCPVCGRPLQVRVTLLGRRVYCQHCGGGFVATDPALGGETVAECVEDDRLAAVDELLERAARQLDRVRS